MSTWSTRRSDPWVWSTDGQSVLLYDDWDVWKVPAHGGGGTNLTRNGKTDGIRYNRVFRLDPDTEGVDLSAPVYINAYGEWTKKAGLVRLAPGADEPERLLWDDGAFATLMKAKDTDTYLYTRGTHTELPGLLRRRRRPARRTASDRCQPAAGRGPLVRRFAADRLREHEGRQVTSRAPSARRV